MHKLQFFLFQNGEKAEHVKHLKMGGFFFNSNLGVNLWIECSLRILVLVLRFGSLCCKCKVLIASIVDRANLNSS